MSFGRAAILAYTMPLWSVPLSAWLLKERITARRMLGVGLGMGAMLLAALGGAARGAGCAQGHVAHAVGSGQLGGRHGADEALPGRPARHLAHRLAAADRRRRPIYAGALGVRPAQSAAADAVARSRASPTTWWSPSCSAMGWYKIVTTVPVGVSSLSLADDAGVGVFSACWCSRNCRTGRILPRWDWC